MRSIRSIIILILLCMISPFLFSACSFKKRIKSDMVTLEQVAYEYDGTAKKPSVIVKISDEEIIDAEQYTVEYSNNIEVGTAFVTITMKDTCEVLTGSVTVYFSIKETTLPNINSIPIAFYNGQNQEPNVVIEGLTLDTDYTLSWEYKQIGKDDSHYAPIYTPSFIDSGDYRVTATGKGSYSGTRTAVYTICKSEHYHLTVSRTDYTFNSTKTDFVFSSEVTGDVSYYYSTQSDGSSASLFTKDTELNAGKYYFYAVIAETENVAEYTTPIAQFNVNKFNIKDSSVSINPTTYKYTGVEITPEVKISCNGANLVLNTDYTVSYSNNLYVGTGIINIAGKGNYTGTKIVNFTIEKDGECVVHTEATPVTEIAKKATTSENGQIDTVVYCKECGHEISRENAPIQKINESSITLENTTFDYTGEAITPSVTIDSLVLGQDFNVSYQDNTNAGTACAIITFIGKYDGSVNKFFTISKVQVDEPTLTSALFTYNGQAQTAVMSSTSEYFTVNGSLTETNAGRYDVIVALKDKNNYVWKNSGNSNNLTLSFVINKLKVSEPTIISSTFTYNGSAQTAVLSNTSNYITINGNLTQTNTGSYDVVISLVDKNNLVWENNNNTNDLTLSFVINKLVVSEPTITSSNFTYDGQPHTATLSHTSSHFTVSDNLTQTNAGTYDVIVALNDKNNSVWENANNSNDLTLKFTINKLIVSEPTITSNDFTYNGQPHTATLSHTSNHFIVSDNLTQTNAGCYDVIVSLADKVNYVWAGSNGSDDLTLTFVINKLVVDAPTITSSDFNYDGQPHTATISYTSEHFTVSGELTQTNAGSYNVIVSLADSLNYAWAGTDSSDDLTLTFVIKAIEVTKPTLVSNTFTYNGNPHTAVLSYTSEHFVVTNNLTQVDAGTYDVTVALVDNVNYTWAGSDSSENLTLQFTINALDINNVNIALDTTTLTYTGQPLSPIPTVTYNGELLTILFEYVPIAENNTDVGTATLKVIGVVNFTGEAVFNFNIVPATVEEPTITGKYNYTGSPLTATLSYKSNLFEASNNVQTNVGTYDVTVSLKDKKNYVWKNSGNNEDLVLKFTIDGISVNDSTIEILSSDFTYTGLPIYPSIIVKIGKLLLVKDTDYSVNYYDNVDAGEATIEVVGINGCAGTNQATFIIKPMEVEKPTITKTVPYNGNYQTAEINNLSNYFGISNNSFINAGTYDITISLVDKVNYCWKGTYTSEDLILQFTITPVTIESPTVTGYYIHDGLPKTATLSFTSNKFTVSNDTQTEAGTHKITLALKGENKANYVWESTNSNEDIYIDFVIDESKVNFVNSNDYMYALYRDISNISSSYSLSDRYLFMNEHQFGTNLGWIFAGLKTLETSLLVQDGSYHNFSEVAAAVTYYDKYVISKYNYGTTKAFNTFGNFYEFNLTAQNNGLYYENTISNDYYFSINEDNYKNYSYLFSHIDSTLMNSINPINISGDSYFISAILDKKIEMTKRYISNYGGVFATVGRGVISYTSQTYSTLDADETPEAGDASNDGFIESSHSICLIGWDDTKKAFKAVNSWGVSEYAYNYFWIPYSYKAIYDGLFGYIYTEANEDVKLSATLAGNVDGFNSNFISSFTNPDNFFIYDEDFSVSYSFPSSVNIDNISVNAYQSQALVNSLFIVTKSGSVITITAEAGSISGSYVFEFMLNGNTYCSKDVYVFTGTELSYVELVGKKPSAVINNNLAGNGVSYSYYVQSTTNANLYMNLYLPTIKSFDYNDVTFTIGDVYLNYNDTDGTSVRRLKTSNDMLKVTIENSAMYPNRLRVLIKNLYRNGTDYIVEMNFKVKNNVTQKTTIYTFTFFVSGDKTAVKNQNNQISYNLNGGVNDSRNVVKFANYADDTTMKTFTLYDPTKENATFEGWYLDANFTQKVTVLDSSISGNIILYAKWSS